MKKILAASLLAVALVGAGGTAAHAESAVVAGATDSNSTATADPSSSTDPWDEIVTEDGTPVTVGDVPSDDTPSTGVPHPGTGDTTSSLCEGGVTSRKAREISTTFNVATGANSVVSGDRGVTLSISRTTVFSVAGTVSATASVSVSDVLTTVKKDVGVAVTVTKSGTSSSTGSWTVPKEMKRGQLQIGSVKHKGSVQAYVQNRNCKNVATGTAAAYNIPETGWNFHHVKLS